MRNTVLIMKGKKRKSIDGMVSELEKALEILFPEESYRDELSFYNDEETDTQYIWKIALPEGEDSYFELRYDTSTGEIFKCNERLDSEVANELFLKAVNNAQKILESWKK